MKTTISEESREGMKVFVVDDNEIYLNSLVRSLKANLNCSVSGFISAEECLNRVDEEPSLIISDYFLDTGTREHMNGDRLLTNLKKKHSEIPVLIYTGQPSVDVAAKTFELGATDFLSKDDIGFFKIAQTSAQILKSLKAEYKRRVERNAIIGISSLIVLFVSATLIISSLQPNFLFPFFIIALSVGIAISVISFFLPDIKRKFQINSFKTA